MRTSKLDYRLIEQLESSPNRWNLKQIAQKVGVTPDHLSRALAKKHKTVIYRD